MPRLRRAMHTVRAATTLAPARPAYAAGLRAAVATVLPLVADAVLGLGGATWMSLGGFNGALADKGGPYRTRAATMGVVTVSGALAVLLGTLAGGHLLVVIPLVFVVALAAGLARVWGAAGVSVAGAALSTLAIALAVPSPGVADAVGRAAFAIVGGLVAMTIALVLWPLRPFRPARMAVAEGYRTLAGYAAELARYVRAPHAKERAELPAGSALVRASLEAARTVLARQRRGRPGSSGREEQLIVLGEAVDQIFGHLVAIGETIDSIARADRLPGVDATVAELLARVARSAMALGAAVEAERDPPSVPVDWSGDALRRALAGAQPTPDASVHYRQAAAILDRATQFAAVAATTAVALDSGQAPPAAAGSAPMERAEVPASPLAQLRAVLAPDSLIFRHALRLAVATTLAVAVAEALHLKRGYWLTITVIVILQPYTGATTHRALQRVLGTVLGAILTALLGAAFHDPRAILVLSFLFAATCVALLPVNYAAYSVFLTPTFVLLAEASAGDWHLAQTRVMNTLIGGGLALAGARLLWPSPEWKRLPGYMTIALRANRDYLQCVTELYGDRSPLAGERIRSSRRRVGLAAVNAEESFQRLLGELDGSAADLSPVMTFLTYTRRLTASIAALALARYATAPADVDVLASFTQRASEVLEDLARAIEEGRRPAALPLLVPVRDEEEAAPPLLGARVDRLARQIRLLHDAVDRWTSQELAVEGASARE